MRVIRMSDIGVSSGRTRMVTNSFIGFVMDDGEWLDEDPNEDPNEELIEEVVKPLSVPSTPRAARLLEGTRC